MLMLNPSKILFSIMLVMGSLISISSNSWPATWIGLEINLLAFIPLMYYKHNMMSAEATMKYFIVQAMASSMLLTIMILNFMFLVFKSEHLESMISLTLLIKMGAAPFHMWFPTVMEGLSWMNCVILMTWQKLAPFIILSYLNFNQSIILFAMVSSIVFGSIGGLNQTSVRKIMAYSSINHMGWMLMGMLISENLWQVYFIIYVILSSTIMIIFYSLSSYHMNQITFKFMSPIMKMLLLLNLMSLGGLPPFLGFLPKWMIIQISYYSDLWFITLLMVSFTLVTLFYYIRLSMSSLLINYNQLKSQKSFSMKNSTLIAIMTTMSLLTLPLYSMFYLLL
uniref:NADH-ubiquinone oxidoreductase chain 2 n=1 Tax=Tarbinskiellus portentosus TaxID=2732766 RepID=A0A8F9RYG9_9ORTH|nr:NADH dehydrogenase subunit 2 [Tarbinskiellus portentosus]UBU97842.1 NADH dehydrogenase subunit 2 [Tarbinskiellus sp.]DAZ85802.1 TPA_asm: NADH dehydrogenase subunit 2 [Tarbinskiellus portentosus]